MKITPLNSPTLASRRHSSQARRHPCARSYQAQAKAKASTPNQASVKTGELGLQEARPVRDIR
jgi:hypothetical protein